MYQISALMAGIYNWCLSKAEKMPRWQGRAVEIASLVGFAIVAMLAPGWVFFAYFVIVVVPIGVFSAAHRKVWKARDEQKRSQMSGALKTRKMIDHTSKK